MRLIDADALMPKLKIIRECEQQIYGKESWGFTSKCITAVEDAPTADVRPVKHGVWRKIKYRSICRDCSFRGFASWNYCPNCGRQMTKEWGYE